jgi:hypothetical protein
MIGRERPPDAVQVKLPAGNDTAPPQVRPHHTELRARLLALAFGLVLCLVVSEVVLRVAENSIEVIAQRFGLRALSDPLLPLSYDVLSIDAMAAGQTYVKFDPSLGWVTSQGVDWQRDGIDYRNNADGIRSDRTYAAPPPSGVRRYSAYGDSFTYCEQVQFDDCWTRHLEESLPGTEVLNFGVPGYAPDQAWLRYQAQDGANWRSCAVLIGHMVENINRVVNRFRPFIWYGTGPPGAKPRFVLHNGQLVLLPSPAQQPDQLKDPRWVETNLGPGDEWYFPGEFVRNPLDVFRVVRLARTVAFDRATRDATSWSPAWAQTVYHPGTEGFDVLTAILTQFAMQVRTSGATPVVVVFPFRDEITDASNGLPKPHQVLLDAMQQQGIATVDLTDPLAAQARVSGLNAVIGAHLTPLGNAVAAQALASELPALTASTCPAQLA